MTDATSGPPPFFTKLSRRLRQEVLPVFGRLPAYGKLIYLLGTDGTLPARDKTALLLAIGYQVSPVDLIPGFIPVIGQLDDFYVMLWGIRRTLDALPEERATAHLAAAGLTRAQLDADSDLVRRALQEIIAGGASAAGRGLWGLLKTGITASAYFYYLTLYRIKPPKR